MSEIILSINALLERYMRRKSAHIVQCVILGTIAILFVTAVLVPICISTVTCQVIYGVIIAIIVLATSIFLIKIIKSEEDQSTLSNKANEPVSSKSDSADGRLLVAQPENENTASSRTNDTDLEIGERTSTSKTNGTMTGVRFKAADRAKVDIGKVKVVGDGKGNVYGVDFEAEGDTAVTFQEANVHKT